MIELKAKAIHRQFVAQFSYDEWAVEFVAYRLRIDLEDEGLEAHLTVDAQLNTGEESVFPDSKYEIYLCSYAIFDIPSDYTVAKLKEDDLPEIFAEVLPPAREQFASLIQKSGIKLTTFPREIPEEISWEEIEDMMSRDEIRIADEREMFYIEDAELNSEEP